METPSSSVGSPASSDARVLREALRTSLLDWCVLALPPGEAPARHHRRLIEELERVAAGTTDRLLISMPPGSAKSTYASVLFPAWWFLRHPKSAVIATAHTAALARFFGQRVRDLIAAQADMLGLAVREDDHSATRWALQSGGRYVATGVRGAVTGLRADLALIDDPVRSAAEADSAAAREMAWNWLRADLMTRLRPRGRVVLIMTRWHEDDLAGRLLAREPAAWRTLCLPALAEAGDPIGRAPGEALWPEWQDAAALARVRESVGARVWSALYQQRPAPPEGALFKVRDFPVVPPPVPAEDETMVRAWDLAATTAAEGNDPDWTVGLKLLRERGGRFVVMDVVRLRDTATVVREAVARTARDDGLAVRIGLPQDPGAGGKAQVAWLRERLGGFKTSATPETGSKERRAEPVAARAEAGLFAVAEGRWNAALLDELRDFPFGAKDDQVDALSRAFAMLAEVGKGARSLRINFNRQ